MKRELFTCPSPMPCFARDKRERCTALLKRPKSVCTFGKPIAERTKGKYYPYGQSEGGKR